jgi:xanthine/uracil permease
MNWRIAPFHQAIVGAITHLLAIFVPMVTPALIVGAALQLSAETTAYLVSMAMIASGIGTWLQVNRYGIVGSGLLSIQSVNFSFVTVMIALGSSMKSDGFHEELIMSSLLGVSSSAHFWSSALHLSCPIYVGSLRLPSAVLWC